MTDDRKEFKIEAIFKKVSDTLKGMIFGFSDAYNLDTVRKTINPHGKQLQ